MNASLFRRLIRRTPAHPGGVYGIDLDNLTCAFDSNDCTTSMIGGGGLDEHHAFPLSLGGPDDGPKLYLCPNHHRRQHALIRYLATAPPDWAVLRHFTEAERDAANTAVSQWRAEGSPPIPGWPAPAARDA